MSSDTITLAATKREVIGKQVRALRSNGQTPAVVHNHGKQSVNITVEEKELKKAYQAAGGHRPVVLTVDGKKYTTLVKEVTYKPATNLVFHTVFQAVKANEVAKANVPIQLTGEIPAEKASLLVLQSLVEVEVEALPKDLVDSIEVDASSLTEAGDTITVAELQVPEGITILSDPEQVIATVEIPKDQIAEAEASAASLAADADTGEAAAPEAEAESGEEEATPEENKES